MSTLMLQLPHPVMASLRIFVLDTHPIQYRAPVFRDLARRLPGLEVIYLDHSFDGRRWWFQEYGKIPSQDWNLELLSGYPSRTLGTRAMGAREAASRLWRLLREERPEAVLIYGWYLPEHWVVWAACRLLRIPLVFVGETYSLGGSPIRRALKGVLHPLFFSGVRQIVSIGARTAGFYRSLGLPSSRITEARYCVDSAFFELPREVAVKARAELRDSLAIPDGALLLLFVGRLFERKRPGDMLALHRALKGHRREVATVIVGNGPLEESLRREAASLPGAHVIGFRDQAATRDWYHAADLLVVPSEIETWGLVANEAMAAGCPVAVTETCGTAWDLVLPEETGFVFPVGRIDFLAQWIARADAAPGTLAGLGEAARRRVTSRFNVTQFSEAMAAALRRAVSSSGAA